MFHDCAGKSYRYILCCHLSAQCSLAIDFTLLHSSGHSLRLIVVQSDPENLLHAHFPFVYFFSA